MVRILLLFLCFAAGTAFAKTGLSRKTRDLFEWFDTLGFEDLSKAMVVHIRTGASVILDGVERQDDACVGFLLADNGATFHVVLADLTVCLLTKNGKDEADSGFCGYREISLKAEAQRLLRELRDPAYFRHWQADQHYSYTDRLPRVSQVFVFARACALRGQAEVAESLVNALEHHPSHYDSDPYSGSLREKLEKRLADVADWNLRISLRDSAETWATLRDRASKLEQLFPKGRFRDFANEFATLADEEAEHARAAPASLDGLTPNEKARELTWRLRDEQDLKSDEFDYWPRPWPFEPRKSNGSMAGLRELGFGAVPPLIEELRVTRRARSVSRSNRYGGGVIPTETRELAILVLNDIAGVNFYWLSDFAQQEIEKRWPAVIAAVEDWWHTIGTKGEQQWLVEMVQQGGNRADYCAERLREKYPHAFLEAMLAGTRESTSPRGRADLTKKLWKERDPKVDAFLREELRSGPTLGNRVAAAYGLRQRGIADGEQAVREEWTRLVQNGLKAEETFTAGPGDPPNVILDEMHPFPAEAFPHAVYFMAGGDSAESFHLLLRTWPDLPTGARFELIEHLGRRDFDEETLTTQRASPPTRMLIRELLLTALDDTTESAGSMETREGGSIVDPRLCDHAADYLHRRWPQTFTFDILASESVRERQRITILNIHRREQGIAELPLPIARSKVAATKANHVVAIEWETDSAAPGAALSRKLAGWKGRPLDVEALVTTLTSYAKAPHAGTRGLRFTAFRDGDSTGIVVRLHLLRGAVGKNVGRNIREVILTNGAVLHDSSGVGIEDYGTKRSSWIDFSEKAARVIATPVDKPFMIRAEVSLSP